MQTLRSNLFKVSNYYILGSRKYNVIHAIFRHQCSSLGADLFSKWPKLWMPVRRWYALFIRMSPLYECKNARMQLFINITLYTVMSIENVFFGSDNLTDENNLAVFRNV